MSYAVTADIQERMAKWTLSATTTPSTTQVDDMITQVDGEINSILAAQGVTIPATAPAEFLKFLEGLNADGAAALAVTAMFPDSAGAGETQLAGFLERRYQAGLVRLKDGSAIPDTVTGTTAGYVAPSTYLLLYPDTEDDVDLGTAGEPFFTRAKVF